jgi:hypothetical protein
LYSWRNIMLLKMIKSRNLRWAGHIAWTGRWEMHTTF